MPHRRVIQRWKGNFVRIQNMSTEFISDLKKMLPSQLIEFYQKLLKRTQIQLAISRLIGVKSLIWVHSHSNIKLQLHFWLEVALEPCSHRKFRLWGLDKCQQQSQIWTRNLLKPALPFYVSDPLRGFLSTEKIKNHRLIENVLFMYLETARITPKTKSDIYYFSVY